MPINIPSTLPAKSALENENIFVMTEDRACSQDIRPLQIAIVNLMPTKIATEIQLLRLLSHSPIQVDITLIRAENHISKNTSHEHLEKFYTTFSQIGSRKFDGMIITGAPVEQLPFEEVDYWDELKSIMEYTKKNVFSTLHICWGAQAGLYYHYGIPKYCREEKVSGVYPHRVLSTKNPLFRGFDDEFYAPHSRYTEVLREDIDRCRELEIMVESPEAGVCVVQAADSRQFFITGHLEYDPETLALEYFRDQDKGRGTRLPCNYFTDNDPKKPVITRWRAHANLFFSNWLNLFVYQDTPYDIEAIGRESVGA